MNNMVSFFEIPAANFERAVAFYQMVFNTKLDVAQDENEKMGFFPGHEGAISWSEHMKPSADGVLLSFRVADMQETLKTITKCGGEVIIPKTAIEASGMGFFAVVSDCEGNRIGLHEKS